MPQWTCNKDGRRCSFPNCMPCDEVRMGLVPVDPAHETVTANTIQLAVVAALESERNGVWKEQEPLRNALVELKQFVVDMPHGEDCDRDGGDTEDDSFCECVKGPLDALVSKAAAALERKHLSPYTMRDAETGIETCDAAGCWCRE